MNYLKLLLNKRLAKQEVKHYLDLITMVYNALPKKAKDIFYKHCFLAGGVIRDYQKGKQFKDIDFFFKNDKAAFDFEYHVANSKMLKFISNHTITLTVNGIDIQFCKGAYSGKPEEVIHKFDFTNSMAYYDIAENNLHKSDEFKHAIEHNKVVYNKEAYNPTIAAKRYRKFLDEGWESDTESNLSDLVVTIASSSKSKGSSSDRSFE